MSYVFLYALMWVSLEDAGLSGGSQTEVYYIIIIDTINY